MTPIAGVGVDAVEVERFGEALARRPRLADRLFTGTEQADAAGDPERLAVRFCAKEAVMKALGGGIGSMAWHEVEVVRQATGAPSLRLSAAAATLAGRRGVARWHLSLTHTRSLAVAMVVAES